MSYELIITEKPKAALKIAQALADGKPIRETINDVPFYKITRGNKDIVVACAVGHLFVLSEKGEKAKWSYPVFDVEWKPIFDVSKKAAYARKYFNTIAKLSKDASSYIVACDYDVEGELIGWNIIKFICKKKNAERMKFSTLTKPDLTTAYEKRSGHLDWGLAKAGETRHEMDWYWGINLSRALTLAIKSSGIYRIISAGRVQGPTLKILVDREKEIKTFKPTKFWQIELIGNSNGSLISAWHIKDKFLKKDEADRVIQNTKNKSAFVKEVTKERYKQMPPNPFDLTSLQLEAYRCFKINPKQTMDIAQSLYTDGLISYPRTSSQKLPTEIGYRKIMQELAKQPAYHKFCNFLLEKDTLKPNEGKKTDPAHPAIYPTGTVPGTLEEKEKKIYDLIVHRFLATFGDTAIRETVNVEIDINNEIFIAKGIITVDKGWHELYGRYATFKEEELPKLEKGQEIAVINIELHEKETQPPKRFTPASIVKELERRNLGTKATRAVIIETLYQRGYIKGEPIETTSLGINTTETLEKFCPRIIDEELTRHFEIELDQIQEGKRKAEDVLKEAKEVLRIILEEIKRKEKEIGEKLSVASKETKRQEKLVGKCPICKVGDLRIIVSKATKKRFIACNKYPECKTTFGLPQSGIVKQLKRECPECKYPMVTVIRKGKRPWQLCINPNCPTKERYKARNST